MSFSPAVLHFSNKLQEVLVKFIISDRKYHNFIVIMIDRDAESARSHVTAALAIQILFIAFALFFTFPSRSLVLIAFALIGLLWASLDYVLVLKPMERNRIEEAVSPSLTLGVLQLLFGGFLPGIFLILAYVKISRSVTERMRGRVDSELS